MPYAWIYLAMWPSCVQTSHRWTLRRKYYCIWKSFLGERLPLLTKCAVLLYCMLGSWCVSNREEVKLCGAKQQSTTEKTCIGQTRPIWLSGLCMLDCSTRCLLHSTLLVLSSVSCKVSFPIRVDVSWLHNLRKHLVDMMRQAEGTRV